MEKHTLSEDTTSIRHKNKTEFSLLVFTFLATLAITVFINIVITNIYVVDEKLLASQLANLFVEKVRFALWPEPVERLQYLISITIIPLITFVCYWLFNNFVRRLSDKQINVIYVVAFIISSTLFLLLIYLDLKTNPDNFIFKDRQNLYADIRGFVATIISGRDMWLALLATPFVYYFAVSNLSAKFDRIIKPIIFFVLALLLSDIFLINLSGRDNYFGWYEHFNAVYYSIAQAVNGKYLLVDFTNQYGLYPHFLAPIFKCIGLSVIKYSIVMCSLVVLSYVLLLLFIKNTIHNITLIFLGFIGLIYIRLYMLVFFNFGDSYFQYTPIRFIFPCLLLFLASHYFKNFNRTLYYSIFFISSLSVLWNIDTGFVVFITWLATLCFNELFDFKMRPFLKNCLAHLLTAVVIFSLTVFTYSGAIYLASGHLPDFSLFLKYQKIFYQSGFFMMHMPLFNAWNLIVLFYGIGLIKSASSIINNQNSYRNIIIFLLSILGIGLFSYYQGRSHDFLLTAINYPAFILLIMFADDWITEIQQYRYKKAFPQSFYLSLTLFFLLTLCFLLFKFNLIYHYSTNRLPVSIHNQFPNTQLTENITFLKENTSAGEDILILTEPGYWDGIYYSETGTRNAVNVPGFSELMLQEDYEKIIRFLKTNSITKVFIDDHFNDHVVRSILLENYTLIDQNNEMKAYLPSKAAQSISKESLQGNASYHLSPPRVALVKGLDNFPADRPLAEIQIELNDAAILKRISISATKGGNIVGEWNTRPLPHLWGIGIVDNESSGKLRNDGPRGNNLNLPVGRKLTLLISDNDHLPERPNLKINIDYGKHGHLLMDANYEANLSHF